MAEENDAVMAEVMNLLEAEPAALPLPASCCLDPTFLLFASSLRFWFLPANAKKQSALISHTTKFGGWKTKMS